MLRIARAAPADLPALVHLENQLFTCDRISSRQFRYLLTKSKGMVIKAENDGVIVGSLVLLSRQNSSKIRIYSIGVAHDARNSGIAGKLINYAEEVAAARECRMLTLEVCERNEGAIKLYLRAGFKVVARRDGYYEDGCPALHMRKNISTEDTDS